MIGESYKLLYIVYFVFAGTIIAANLLAVLFNAISSLLLFYWKRRFSSMTKHE